MARSRLRRQPRGFEALESRAMLAGDITANLVGGVLTINGDAAANVFTLTPNAGNVRVTGIATTINLLPGPTDFAGVTDILINLGAGADNVTIQTLTLVNLTVNGEADADTITLNTTMAVTGLTALDGGTEADIISVSSTNTDTLQISGAVGTDTLSIGTGTVVTGTASLDGGADADGLSVSDADLSILNIFGRAGADTMTVNTTTVITTSALLDGGTEADLITFDNSSSVALQILGDTGDDTITVSTATVTTLTIDGEENIDDITVTGLTNTVASTLTVSGGDGNDTIDFLSAVGTLASPLTINGNAGDDFLRVNNLILATLTVNGGSGDDSLVLGIDFQPDIVTVTGKNTAIAAGSLTVNTTLTVNGDGGDDAITAYRVFGTADWTVDTGSANNLATSSDIFTTYWTVSDQLSVFGGIGADELDVFFHTSNGATTVSGGAGNDLLQAVISHFALDADFFGNDGSDTVAVDTNRFEADLNMDGGIGNDLIYLAACVINANATIFGSDGNDFGFIGKHASGTAGGNVVPNGLLQLDAGSGIDNFNISFNALLGFYGNLGNENDSVETGYNLIQVPSIFDGGFGINSILRTSLQNLSYLNFAK